MANSVCRNLRDGVFEGEFAPAIMIYDSLQTFGGTAIFLHFVRSLAFDIAADRAQAKGLVLITTDRRPESYQGLLRLQMKEPSWLHWIDCFNDPLGWLKTINEHQTSEKIEQNLPHNCSLCSDVQDLTCLMSTILSSVKKALGGEKKARTQFSIAIDSVSSLLRQNSVHSVASFLSTLRSSGDVSSIIWSIHYDLHHSRTLSALEYISSTVVSINQIGRSLYPKEAIEYVPDGNNIVSNSGILGIRQKRRSGRVREVVEEFKVEGFEVNFSPSPQLTQVETVGKTTLPRVQFNLQLTDKEREDRAKVILPFEHQGDGKEFLIYDGRADVRTSQFNAGIVKDLAKTISSETGEVHYLRDSDDERPDSDEDPDDDLDI